MDDSSVSEIRGSHGIGDAVRPHVSTLVALFRAIDSLLIGFMLWFILKQADSPWLEEYTYLVFFSAVIFVFLAEAWRVYTPFYELRMRGLSFTIITAWCITMFIVLLTFHTLDLTKTMNWQVVAYWVIGMPIVLFSSHYLKIVATSGLSRRMVKGRRVAILGANPLGFRLYKAFKELSFGTKDKDIEFFYCDKPGLEGDIDADMKARLSNAKNLQACLETAQSGELDAVYITLPMRAESKIKEIIDALADTTVSVYLIPDVYDFRLLHSHFSSIRGIPALSIYDSPLRYHWVMKRILDIVLSSIFLMILLIPMVAIAIAVKVTSRGPVFFKQQRYGVGGEKIRVWKFRSMSVCEDGDKVVQAKKNDARITRVGGFLRRTSLDELPQFINVLIGTMSIVGPRPHAIAHNEYYRKQIHGYMLRHKVKPGITGLAQINGYRGETNTMEQMEGRIRYDLEYIRRWSHGLDLKIIFLTAFKVLNDKQAY